MTHQPQASSSSGTNRDQEIVTEWTQRWASAAVANRRMRDVAAARVNDPSDDIASFAVQIIAVGEDEMKSDALVAVRRVLLIQLAEDWVRHSTRAGAMSGGTVGARLVRNWIVEQANAGTLPPSPRPPNKKPHR